MKPTRARQKRMIQSDDALWQIAWTREEEITTAKCWVPVSENSKYGNGRKKAGFWCEVLDYMKSRTKQYGRRTYDMVCGKWKTVRPVVIRFCGVYDSPKWLSSELSKFATEYGEGSKRHKSSGSSSFNTESGNASINLNTNVGDNDEDEVQEIRRPRGRDKARASGKNKGLKASGLSSMNDDALAWLMVTEMTIQEKKQREAFLEIKRREVECREQEIAAQEYR
ncbi:hypothetical protein Tco_0461255 [Tanacetum coccineum]